MGQNRVQAEVVATTYKPFRPIMELGHFVGLNLELDGRMLGYY